MNIIKRAARAWKALTSDNDNLFSSYYIMSGKEGISATTSYSSLCDAYKSWIYIAVDKIAKTVATLPLSLYAYKKSGKFISKGDTSRIKQHLKSLNRYEGRKFLKEISVEKIEIEDHPFLDLLKHPNNAETRFMLWYQIMTKLELSGACGIYSPLDRFGVPSQLVVLPLTSTASLKPIPDQKEIIKGFIYKDGNLKQQFDLSELTWLRYPNPKTPFEGMSALKSQTYPYDIDNYIEQLNYYMFKNRAVPGLNLFTDQKLNDEQVSKIRTQIQDDFKGATKAGKLLVTHSGLQVGKPLNQPFKDLMLGEITEGVRDKLLAAYDTPAGKVGLVKDVNRANMEILNETFMMECIRPKIMMIEEMFETFILPKYDDRLTLDFVLPEFNQRDTDIKERETNLKYGYTTINEEREKEGYEPVEWGEKPILPYSYTTFGEQEEKQVPAKSLPIQIESKALSPSFWTKERKEIYWKEFSDKIDNWKQPYEKAAKKLFKEQLKEVFDNLDTEGKRFRGLIAGWSLNKVKQFVKAKDATKPFNIDKKKAIARTKELFEPVYKKNILTAGQVRLDELSGYKSIKQEAETSYDWNVNDPEVEQWLGDRLDFFSKEITGTTFDEVKAILRDGFNEGQPNSEIAKTLRERFDKYDKYRANMIADTECIASSNFADVTSVKLSGLEKRLKKFWIDSKDAHVRETHQQAATKYSEDSAILIDTYFHVGNDSMLAPGLGAQAEENINCRCTVGYVERK